MEWPLLAACAQARGWTRRLSELSGQDITPAPVHDVSPQSVAADELIDQQLKKGRLRAIRFADLGELMSTDAQSR
jgi:hypothetical protein